MRLSRSEKNSTRLLGSVLKQILRALIAISYPSGNSIENCLITTDLSDELKSEGIYRYLIHP